MTKPRGRHRSNPWPAPVGLRRLASEALVRNSAFLIINTGFTAICGFGAVALLTRLYTVESVGLSSTAVSAGGLIGFITQFGINYSLPRFLPTSAHRNALINTVLTVTLLATLLGAATFLLLPVAVKLYMLGGWLFAVVFLLGTTLDVGKTNLEIILVTDRQAGKVAGANIVANLMRLAGPAIFVFAGSLGAYISRIAYGIVGFLVLAVILGRRGQRFRPAFSNVATREMRRFSGGSYLSNLLATLPLWLLPIIILSRFGSKQSAFWYIAMAVSSLATQVPGSVASVLLVEVAHRPSERQALVRRAAKVIASIAIPLFGIVYIAAPVVLKLFGSHYSAGSLAPLHWLIIAGFISSINYVSGTIIYLAKKTSALALINTTDAIIVLGLAMIWAHDAREVALSWFIGEIPNTLLFAVVALRALRQVQGRWELLGGDRAEYAASQMGHQEATRESQLAALDVLINLSRVQRTGPMYDSAQFSGADLGRGRTPSRMSSQHSQRGDRQGRQPACEPSRYSSASPSDGV